MAAVLVQLTVFSSYLLAAFVNGGFETGDFTGWTKSSYLTSGPDRNPAVQRREHHAESPAATPMSP